MVYEPREDSMLLLKYVKKLAKGSVIDVGTGSGILAEAAAARKQVKKVLATDIQDEVIEHCRKKLKNKKISFRVSNLFSNVTETFDTIIFNPPYLPNDPKVKDIALDGGKHGYEIIEKLLKQVLWHLRDNGILLLVFSSLSKKEHIDFLIKQQGMKAEVLETMKIAFEELYCYKITLTKT